MRRSTHLFLFLLLLILLVHSLSVLSSPPHSVPRSAAPPPSSSPSPSSLLPSLTSLLTDLWNHPVAEDSVLSFAQRHVHFFLSTLVSPLQLLDFSHLNTPPLTTRNESPPSREEEDGWQHSPLSSITEVVPSSFPSASEEEEFLRLQSDPSHALRVSVGAHRRSSAEDSLSAQRVDAPHIDQSDFDPVSVGLSVLTDVFQPPISRECQFGQVIRFVNSTRHQLRLCWCPYDWQGPRCELRVWYHCPIRLISPSSSCNDIRSRPPSTSSLSHSREETPFSLSPSPSSFFRYEPVLSGTPPPCLSITGATTVSVNFTCQFDEDEEVKEGWGDPALYERIQANYTQINSVVPFNYNVLVRNTSGAALFALSENITDISFDVLQHNTAHPSQSSLILSQLLDATHLRYSPITGARAASVNWTMDPALMDRNLKRGGRILLTLDFGTRSWGLNSEASLLPWRLYVEDSTFTLPGPTRQAILTRFQWGVLVVALLVVFALLGYRWYQRRQTAKFQALMAEQRGKQKSWFEASE